MPYNDSHNNTTNIINIERFRRLIVRIPEEQFPDRLRFVIKGYKLTETTQQNVEDTDPRIQQLVADAANNPAEKIYQLQWIEESDFKYTSKIKDVNYKVYNEKFPLNEITQVHGWSDRDDVEDDTAIDVVMYAATESGQLSSNSPTTINMDDVWAFNFQMTRQTMTPTTIINYLLHGTKSGSVVSQIGNFFSYFFETVASLPGTIKAAPKAIISKFLGPDSPEVQAAIATIATESAKYKPVTDKILLVSTIIKEFIEDPEEALKTYGALLFSFLLAEVGPAMLGDLVYDFFGGYPVTGTPLDTVNTAMESISSIESEYI